MRMVNGGDNDPIQRIKETRMRVVRLLHDGDCRYGLADEDTVTLISDEPFAAWEPEGLLPLADARLLSPVAPTKVVCVGLNYKAHIAEMGHDFPTEPVIFIKPSTAVIGPHQPIPIPEGVGRVDYEAELGVVIGRRTHRASRSEAAENVLGFTCGNDVTARDIQQIDGQWTRAKGFDGFCPLGPWVETDVDPTGLTLECFVNGELKQQATTSDMLFHPYELVSFVSQVMTLVPGDVILTGTPGGIGPIVSGDSVEVRISGVGSLVNPVGTLVHAGAGAPS
ncbi:MAG TPA: fumarylacetoacetate hydrolase family protein [Coriobacteriia bacterium]|nr:fumarylacetoacetate hydrolase family protein [Coriobacteriia bacterium]